MQRRHTLLMQQAQIKPNRLMQRLLNLLHEALKQSSWIAEMIGRLCYLCNWVSLEFHLTLRNRRCRGTIHHWRRRGLVLVRIDENNETDMKVLQNTNEELQSITGGFELKLHGLSDQLKLKEH
ncbi:hypothetical protein NC652_031061 [Populus alba x Populus x berolinensis]|nr:hypothetical protein NC652_031061 [Populus alba x Populus x berolinensis]